MDKTEFFITNEVQIDLEGNKSELPIIYDDERDAYSKYYDVLSVAVKSAIPYHAANIIRSDGVMIEGKVYDRRTYSEPTPEPVEEV